MPNYDAKTGIHYGVIHQGKVLQAWADSSEEEYTEEDIELMAADSDIGAECEPVAFVYDEDGYKAIQDSDGVNIMVIKSPYFTYARPCSPCYPNAGDLDSPSEQGIKTYCFDKSWYDDGKAPYKVYKVK